MKVVTTEEKKKTKKKYDNVTRLGVVAFMSGGPVLNQYRFVMLEEGGDGKYKSGRHFFPKISTMSAREYSIIENKLFNESLQQIAIHNLGWGFGGGQRGNKIFKVIHNIHCDPKQTCTIGGRRITLCSYLLNSGKITKWTPDEVKEQTVMFHKMMEYEKKKYTHRILKTISTYLSKKWFPSKKGEYTFHERPCDRIRPDDFFNLCSNRISQDYITNYIRRCRQYQFNGTGPHLKILTAHRTISKENFKPKCHPPDCYEYYSRMGHLGCRKPTIREAFYKYIHTFLEEDSEPVEKVLSVFEDWVKTLPEKEKEKELCDLLSNIYRNIVGGMCLYEEKPGSNTVVIYVICSNRNVGSLMIDHLRKKYDTVYIDQPLESVVGYYKKLGFEFMNPEMMVWHRFPSKDFSEKDNKDDDLDVKEIVEEVLRSSKRNVKSGKEEKDFQQVMKKVVSTIKPKTIPKDDFPLLHDLYQHTVIIPLDDLRVYVDRFEKEGMNCIEDLQEKIRKGWGEDELMKRGIEKRHARALLEGVKDYRKMKLKRRMVK
jgi:hypothetical protein